MLVAEDNPDTQRFVVEMLARMGYQAEIVEDGQQAVEEVRARAWDAVLMDLQMPRKDGLAATREIRDRCPDGRPYIIAMTANAMAGDRERCLEAGMNDYVSKPINAAELREKLCRHLKSASLTV